MVTKAMGNFLGVVILESLRDQGTMEGRGSRWTSQSMKAGYCSREQEAFGDVQWGGPNLTYMLCYRRGMGDRVLHRWGRASDPQAPARTARSVSAAIGAAERIRPKPGNAP